MKLIVCQDIEGNIGGNNSMLWQNKEEMDIFKNLTIGNVVIMGYNTFISLKSKPLPNRLNIVLVDNRNNSLEYYNNTEKEFTDENTSLFFLEKDSELYNNILSELSDKSIFVIGGGNTYKEFLDNEDISEIYISTILEDYSSSADVKFPDIDWEEWKLVYEENHKNFIHQKWVNKVISTLI